VIEPVPEEQGSGLRVQGSEQGQGPGIRDEGPGTRDQGPSISGRSNGGGAQENPATNEGIGNRKQGTESAEGSPIEARAASHNSPADTRLKVARGVLETRLEEAFASLSEDTAAPSATERQGHLALLKRWYYRPEVRRTGEVFFPGEDGAWPVRAILRGIGRVAAKQLHGATGEGHAAEVRPG